MIMPIAQYPFDGPHRSLKNIEDAPGVFAILCEFVDKYYLLDVDHSDSVRQAIQEHKRRRCWEKYRRGRIRYAVLYDKVFPDEESYKTVKKIRSRYHSIPCGSIVELGIEKKD